MKKLMITVAAVAAFGTVSAQEAAAAFEKMGRLSRQAALDSLSSLHAEQAKAAGKAWHDFVSELEPTTGEVVITPGERMAVLKQNHFEFDEYEVLTTVIMGHKRLYEIMKEKDELYAKEDFTDADGERITEWV